MTQGWNAATVDAAVHELAQELQVIEMAISSIELQEGERHAAMFETVRRALARLDQGLEDLAALARAGKS